MHSCLSSNTQGQVKDNNAVIVPSPDASNKAIVRLLEAWWSGESMQCPLGLYVLKTGLFLSSLVSSCSLSFCDLLLNCLFCHGSALVRVRTTHRLRSGRCSWSSSKPICGQTLLLLVKTCNISEWTWKAYVKKHYLQSQHSDPEHKSVTRHICQYTTVQKICDIFKVRYDH